MLVNLKLLDASKYYFFMVSFFNTSEIASKASSIVVASMLWNVNKFCFKILFSSLKKSISFFIFFLKSSAISYATVYFLISYESIIRSCTLHDWAIYAPPEC